MLVSRPDETLTDDTQRVANCEAVSMQLSVKWSSEPESADFFRRAEYREKV